jgi:hypothetical protein
MIDMEGYRTDDFDQYVKEQVEDAAAPALRSWQREDFLTPTRSAVAFFVALTAARSPEMMKGVVTEHLASLAPADRGELDDLVKLWCAWTGKPYDSKSHSEFPKPSSFGAIWTWSQTAAEAAPRAGRPQLT